MPLVRSKAEILESVDRRMQLASASTCVNMKRGLATLACVVTTAPLIGLFGTVIGTLDAFKGCIGQKWFCTQMIIQGLCEALVTAALGLLVAIPAAWFYNYLSDRLEIYNIEMHLASSELLTYLATHQQGHFSPPG